MASLPLNFFRTYTYSTTPPGGLTPPGSYILQRLYYVNETNMSGMFTANPFASFNGVGYTQVTKTDVDNINNTNGKTVSYYYNSPDYVFNGIEQAEQYALTLPACKASNDTCENGSLKSEYYYDSNNNLLKKIVNTYSKVTSSLYYGARLEGFALNVRYGFPDQYNVFNQLLLQQNIVGYYPIYDFNTLLSGTNETDYYGSNAVTTTTTNTYDVYSQLSNSTKTNSTYNETTSFLYPYDFPSNTVLAAMTAANRLADIVSAGKGTPTTGSNFGRSYNQIGSLFVAAKDSSWTSIIGGTPLNNTIYDQYDPGNGNILQYTKNTVPNSIVWDYNKEYVTAEVKNASYTNVAYTSFEADGTGRWKFTGTPFPDPAAPTGQKVYSLANGSIYRDSLNTTLTYIVSYWSKNGAQTVSGSGTTKQGYTFNGYTYYETTVAHPAGGTITVSGTGTIDELRLYPNTAQMKSYTYAPLVGVTSESNEGGKIVYYEYDYAMRLLDIRDQNKNILKAYCYNYAGQLTNCGLDITYSSEAQSQSFTRNNCSSGYIGSPVTYTVPLAKYTSTMSLDDANYQATEDMAAHGQPNANTYGSCVIPPAITNVAYGGQGTGSVAVTFTSIPGCLQVSVNFKDLAGGNSVSIIGSCTSPRNVTVPLVGHTYQFTITCYSTAFPNGIVSAPVNYTVTQ